MEVEFWHQKWEDNDIAFHEGEANALLVKYFNSLSIAKGDRVFLPLCGKTRDIAWLLSNNYRVAGAELSELAIEQLFSELGIEPEVGAVGEMKHYRAKNIDIFVGDIFALSGDVLGPVDAIYDRAALVALPEEMRSRYAAHLVEISGKAPQLLICFEYDQSMLAGPPFSIGSDAVNQYYGDSYSLAMLASENVAGGLKGQCAALEQLWLLQPQAQG